jgi:hypothetical protein
VEFGKAANWIGISGLTSPDDIKRWSSFKFNSPRFAFINDFELHSCYSSKLCAVDGLHAPKKTGSVIQVQSIPFTFRSSSRPSAPPVIFSPLPQDSTIRFHGPLDTYTNIVYRGHRYLYGTSSMGPRGIYFASRDRTAFDYGLLIKRVP